MIAFEPTGWTGIEGFADRELEVLRAAAEVAVDRAGLHLESAVKTTLGPASGPRTGLFYKVSKSGPLHQASAPGEPPAVLFGALRQSITHSAPKWEGWAVFTDVGSNKVYARRLEWGGVDSRGVRILPRPYFEPTFLREQEAVERILESAVAAVPPVKGG